MRYRRLKKFIFIVITGCFFTCSTTAGSMSPRETIEKSLQISLNTSYQSIIPASKKEKETYKDPSAKYKIYYSVQENGSVFERRDLIIKDQAFSSHIINSGGFYTIVYPPNAKPIVVKRTGELPYYNPLKVWKFPFQLIEKYLHDKNCKYQFAGYASYKGISCKKIIVSVPYPNDEDLAKRLKLPLEDVIKEKKRLESFFPVRRVYLIGAKNLFLYQCSYYNKEGKQTFSAEWGEVQFNTSLSNDLFKIPDGKYTEFGDNDDYAKLEKRTSTKKSGILVYIAKCFSNIEYFFELHLSAMLHWGGKLHFGQQFWL